MSDDRPVVVGAPPVSAELLAQANALRAARGSTPILLDTLGAHATTPPPIRLRGMAAYEAGIATAAELGLRVVKVRAYAKSLTEQFRAQLQERNTRDEVQALHLSLCSLAQGKAAAAGTRRKWTRLAQDRIDAIDKAQREAPARALIVPPWAMEERAR